MKYIVITLEYFRADTIGGNILFGLAFFIVTRKIKTGKLRDYYYYRWNR